MKHKLLLILLCLAAPTFSPAQNKPPRLPAGEQSNQSLSAAKKQKIEAAVSAWMAQHKAPALSVAIVLDNQLAWANGYGLADVENNVPAKAQTVYRLASISKSLTAVAVMQLVERGKLDLNQPVHKYCQAYPEKQMLKDASDKQFSITIRQLLTHFAGVRHNKLDEVLTTRHYGGIAEAVASFKDDPLVVEPETKYSYSTPGYTLLGCAIENASGAAYIDYMRENVFKPAGATRTAVDDVYAVIPNRARGYRKTSAGAIQNAPLHDTSIKIPGGGLAATVEDMARFAIALNQEKLVKKETLARMWTRPKTRDGKESNYAFGFLIGEKDGQKQVFNDGSQAGTRTYLFLMPDQKFAIALATNLERAWCEELVPKIIEILKEQ